MFVLFCFVFLCFFVFYQVLFGNSSNYSNHRKKKNKIMQGYLVNRPIRLHHWLHSPLDNNWKFFTAYYRQQCKWYQSFFLASNVNNNFAHCSFIWNSPLNTLLIASLCASRKYLQRSDWHITSPYNILILFSKQVMYR